MQFLMQPANIANRRRDRVPDRPLKLRLSLKITLSNNFKLRCYTSVTPALSRQNINMAEPSLIMSECLFLNVKSATKG